MSEETKIPGMPGLQQKSEEAEGSSQDDSSLQPPSHEEVNHFEPPKYDSPEQSLSSEVDVPVVPKQGIEVVATRKGFYNQTRRVEGDEFFVKEFGELGDWMKCVDKHFEKKRVEAIKAKKQKAKK